MAYYPYERTITTSSRAGMSPAAGVEVRVYQSGTSTEKTLYSDTAGTSLVSQPVTTDDAGNILIYTSPGRITLQISVDSANSESIEDLIPDVDNIESPTIGEIPSGTINGSNQSFTLSSTPNSAKTMVYCDGLRYVLVSSTPSGRQFNLSGTTLTVGTPPTTDVVVDYWIK